MSLGEEGRDQVGIYIYIYCNTYCLPTAAHAASVWFGWAGNVRSRGRHSGSVAVIVADM